MQKNSSTSEEKYRILCQSQLLSFFMFSMAVTITVIGFFMSFSMPNDIKNQRAENARPILLHRVFINSNKDKLIGFDKNNQEYRISTAEDFKNNDLSKIKLPSNSKMTIYARSTTDSISYLSKKVWLEALDSDKAHNLLYILLYQFSKYGWLLGILLSALSFTFLRKAVRDYTNFSRHYAPTIEGL